MIRARGAAFLFVIVPLLTNAGTTEAQAPSTTPIDPRVRAELVVAREAVWRAYFQGDSSALVRLLPERMTAMGRDRAEIIHDAMSYARSGGKYAGMEFTDEEFFVNGSTAVLWSHYVAHLTSGAGTPNDEKGRAIELFVKEKGRWVNPYWHLDGEK
jgi:ketosteroid isomerase-like protein